MAARGASTCSGRLRTSESRVWGEGVGEWRLPAVRCVDLAETGLEESREPFAEGLVVSVNRFLDYVRFLVIRRSDQASMSMRSPQGWRFQSNGGVPQLQNTMG